jgi:hypothetical protein
VTTQRAIIFGSREAVHRYVREHDLALGTWYHASSVGRVTGIDVGQFTQTVVLGPLDGASTEALTEWARREGQQSGREGR